MNNAIDLSMKITGINILFAVLFSVFSHQAHALDVAQLKTFDCAKPSSAWSSEVLLFEQNSVTYALASERRVIPSSDQTLYCHEIEFLGKKYDAKYVNSNWGLGVALLSVSTSLTHESLPVLPPAKLKSGKPIEIVSSQKSVTGKLLSAKSDRHAIPDEDFVYEIWGGLVNTTQVGAPVLYQDKATSKSYWLGTLSHQYLKIVSGSPTRLEEWKTSDTQYENHLVVISSESISQWVSDVMANSYQSAFHVSAQDRLNGVDRITAGKLIFEELCPSAKTATVVTGDYPIGGADGVGIGGSIQTSRMCKLSLSVDTTSVNREFPVSGFKNWQQDVMSELKSNSNLDSEIWYLTKRNSISNQLERWSFGLLSEFFTDFKRTGMSPVLIYQDQTLSVAGIDKTLNDIRDQAQVVIQSASDWDQSLMSVKTPATQSLIQQLFFISVLLKSEAQSLIELNDIEFLLSKQFELDWDFVCSWGPMADNPSGLKLEDEYKKLLSVYKKVKGL